MIIAKNLLNKLLFFITIILLLLIINPLTASASVTIADYFENDSGLWEYNGNAYRDSSGGYVVLTQNVDNQVGAIWLKGAIAPPFTVSFRYKAGDGTGADGIVFMFNKEKVIATAVGRDIGFSGNGYGVEFDNWYNSERK